MGRKPVARLVLLMLLGQMAGPAAAQAPAWQQALAPAQPTGSTSVARATAADAAGDVYVTGSFTGQVSFGATTLTSAGGTDAFVARWSAAAGTWAWARAAGGTGADQGNGIAVSGAEVYLTGFFTNNAANSSAVQFGGTALSGSGAAGNTNAFVARYDAGGNYQWARAAGGTGADQGLGIATDGSSVYVSGAITNSAANAQLVQFGGTALNGAGSTSSLDAFVARYDATGACQWARAGGGTGADQASGVAVNGAEVYLTGFFTSTGTNANAAQFGGTALNGSGTTANADVFVARYDATGAYQWAQAAGGTGPDQGQGLAVDNSAVYLTGFFTNTSANANAVQFGGAALNGSAAGSSADVFVARYDATGAYQWARAGGGSGADQGNSIAVSGPDVYVAGTFANTSTNANAAQFGGLVLNGSGAASNADVFVARYDATGAYQWARAGGGTGADQGLGIAARGAEVYVAGQLTPAAALGSFSFAAPAGGPLAFGGWLRDLPSLTGFVLGSGAVGSTISLTGTFLTGATAITFSGTSGNVVTTGFTVASPTSITGVVVPAGATTGPVTVTTPKGTSGPSSARFIVTPALSFTPGGGAPGTLVTLTGAGLGNATGVSFNGVLTNGLTVVNSSTVTAYVPIGASTGPITVSTGAGPVGTSVGSFSVAPLPPDLTLTVTPAGVLSLCAGNPTLTASLSGRPFLPGGTGAANTVLALALQPDGQVLAGGLFTQVNGAPASRLVRLNPDGSLNPAFAPTGTGLNNAVHALALQPDGKILAGGAFTQYNGMPASYLVRLNADGTLDTSFAPTGTGLNNTVTALALQPDGRVLAGGTFTQYNGTAAPYLIRLNADGSFDNSFAISGTGLNGAVNALALQADGRVLAGGAFTQYNGAVASYLLRLNGDGTPDATFAPTGTGLNGAVNALALQPDGQVVAGGAFSLYNGATAGRLVRLNADGSRDAAFASAGAGLNNTVNSIGLQPDGKVVAGGSFTQYNGTAASYLIRLNADGSRDAAFAPAGTGLNNRVNALVLQPDGKVLAGGTFTAYNGATLSRLVRLNADGSRDDTPTPITGATYTWTPAGVGATLGSITGAGTYQVTATVGGVSLTSNPVTVGSCPVLTGFSPATGLPGTLVTLTGTGLGSTTGVSFNGVLTNGLTVVNNTTVTAYVPVGAGTGPITLTALGGGSSTAPGTFTVEAIAPDLAVTISPAGPLTACASPTLTATAGIRPLLPTGAGLNNQVLALALQPDGKIMAGGAFTQYNGTAAPYLIRLNADGSRDAAFAPAGTGLNNRVNALVLQPDGKVLAGGTFTAYNGATLGRLVRLNADGSVDNTFAPTGTGLNNTVNALVLQPDGKVLVGGAFTQYNGTVAPYLVRLNADGSVDAAFNTGAGLNSSVAGLALQPDGKVLVGGAFTAYNGTPAYRLVRLHADGSLDTSFAPAGTGLNNNVSPVLLQADGKVMVGGSFTAYNGTPAPRVARLNADGTLDTSFAATGTGLNGAVSALALQPDGKIVAGGAFTQYNGAVASYLVRLNADGSADNTLAPVGTGLGNTVGALALQPDGKILAGGTFLAYNGGPAGRVARLNANGSLDNTPTPVAATYAWTPGGSTGPTLTPPASGGSFQVAATFNGFSVSSSPVVVAPCLPGITSFGPNPGGRGQAVTITGTNLAGVTALLVNGVDATASITSNTATSLTFRVPLAAPASGTTTLTTAGGTATSPAFALLADPGNALAFDGVDDYVRIPDSSLLDFGSGDFTVEAWVLKQAGSAGFAHAAGPGGKWNSHTAPGTNEWLLQTTVSGNDDIPSFIVESGSTTYTAAASQPLTLNRWYHLAGVRRGNTLQLYVDGVAQPATTLPAGTALNNVAGRDLLLGALAANGTAGSFARQRLDELRIWGVARTAAELQAGMSSVVPATAPGLLAYYSFDAGRAATASAGANAGQTTLYDLTSNEQHGSLSGFALSSGSTTSNWVESYALVVPTATAATAIFTAGFTANWTEPALGTVSSYLVDVSTSGTFASVVPGSPFTVAAPATSLALNSLASGTTYYYRVRADQASVAGQGAASNVVAVSTPCVVLALTQNLTLPLEASGTVSLTAAQVNSGSYASCGLAPGTGLRVSPSTFACTNLGPNRVTLTVTDVNGNVSTATATVTVTMPAGSTATWTGAASSSWTDCANWRFGKLPSATVSVVLPAGLARYPALPGGSFPVRDLTIEAGAAPTLAPGAELQVHGSFSSLDATALGGTVVLTGNAATQTLSGTPALAALTVSKSGGVAQLAADLSITQALQLNGGTLLTGAYTVLLGPAATLAETPASYVTGQVETTRVLGTAGTGSSFGGLGLSLTPATGSVALPGSTRVRRTTGAAPAAVSRGAGIRRYFDIQPAVNAGLNVDVVFGYFEHELNGIAEDSLGLFRSVAGAGGPWTAVHYGTRNPAANTVSRTGVASFSHWTLARAAPLPYELLSFTAARQDQAVQLRWRTQAERNTAHFVVERSADGRTFEAIAQVDAQRNSTRAADYSHLDLSYPNLSTGLYYRLRLVEANGDFAYSGVRIVPMEASTVMLLYPNPSQDGTLSVRGVAPGAAIDVFDALGRAVLATRAGTDGTVLLRLPAGIRAGVYLVRSGTQAGRLLVQ